MENKKLTEEELTTLRSIQQRSAELSQQLGNFEMQRINLDLQRKTAEQVFAEIREEELKIGRELFDKYGNGSLDLERGEFVPVA